MTRFTSQLLLCFVIFTIVSVGIATVYIKNIYSYDIDQFKVHSTIIADDVWAVNPAGANPYLQLAIEVNSYKYLSVTHLGGEPFTHLTSPPLHRFEQILLNLKLIWTKKISADIIFNNQKIGIIEGEKYVKAIYPLTNIMIFLLLIMITIVFFIYLYSNRKYLEQQISERTRNLQESERRFHDLVNLLPEMVWEADYSGKIIYANQIAVHRLGLSERQGQPVNWIGFVIPGLQQQAARYFEASLRGDDSGLKEFHFVCGEGTEFPVLLRSSPILQGQITIGTRFIAIDISDRHALEEQLRRAQKMKAIGLMAGGVAHDLNNILSGVINYPELMLLDLPGNSPLRRPLQAIRKSGMQAAEVVSDLLTVARGVAAVKVVIDPRSLIREYLDSPEFLQLTAFNPHISVKTKFSTDIHPISCSPIHVKKCLMNLVTNASEAIKGKGTITIAASNRFITVEPNDDAPMAAGEYAVITVKDNGPGIQAKDLKHIFEPFYTKKTMGRSGTGLGLAVVWNTMKDHDGAVTVVNDKNGTTFELHFPRSHGQQTLQKQSVDLSSYRGSGQTILVVDDEQQQRNIAVEILTNLGYRVSAVASGEEAVSRVLETPFDLIILDMIMGAGMNGRETYEKIIAIHPGQKAIISSGFSRDTEVKATQRLGAGGFISKPFTIEQLAKIVFNGLHATVPSPHIP
ncbi:PAS domain S-box-containing protein [Desulfoprunum benzoelyticum]|uniref:histidine kinase n=1 Tax=Desulfoprunum benzoelyticum TaxID=1506996 RepID=A0A840V496_9BACT|nr:PAS domain S-box-containing protein [Desulfoprunum benzoelyticum]